MPIFNDNRPLLDGFRQGAKDALHRIYEFYLNDVVGLVRHGFVAGTARVAGERRRSHQLDTTHDIFVKAFAPKARTSFDGLRPYRPFLFRIGKNLIIDRLRKRGEEVPIDEVDFEGETLPAEHDGASREDQLHFTTLSQATREFIAGCDEELQTFVQLRFDESCSQYDVVEKMGITRRRVRTLEKLAQEGLRAHLKKKGLL